MSRAIAITKLPGLKSLMQGRQLSRVAENLGIDKGFLSQLISCKRGASLAMALRLAGYFQTTVEALLLAGATLEPASGEPTAVEASVVSGSGAGAEESTGTAPAC